MMAEDENNINGQQQQIISNASINSSVLNSERNAKKKFKIKQNTQSSAKPELKSGSNAEEKKELQQNNLKKNQKASKIKLSDIVEKSERYMTNIHEKTIESEIAIYEDRIFDKMIDPDDDLTESECRRYHSAKPPVRRTRGNRNNLCYHHEPSNNKYYYKYEGSTRIFFGAKQCGSDDNASHSAYIMGQRMIRSGKVINGDITFVDGNFIRDEKDDQTDGFSDLMKIIDGYKISNKLIIIPQPVKLYNEHSRARLMAMLSSKHPISIIMSVDDTAKWSKFVDNNGIFDDASNGASEEFKPQQRYVDVQ